MNTNKKYLIALKRITERLKAIWNLPEQNEKRYREMLTVLGATQAKVNERCEVHADIRYKEPHQVIVIGRYKGRDYVRIFGVSEPTFYGLIDRLHYEERNSKVGRFDMPSGYPDISAVYDLDKF